MSSVFFFFVVVVAALVSCSSSSSLSFPVLHRDSPSSPLRSASLLLPPSFPPLTPLHHFVSSGLALRHRLQHPPRSRPVVGRFSYLDENAGDFYLSALVGSPPQELILTLDTGSELSWTACSPCKLCDPRSGGPPFRFARSSSYERVPCTSPLCSQSLGFAGGVCSNDSARSCVFELQYGDGSQDAGYLSADVFHLGKQVAKPFVFGCAVVEVETVPTPTSGLMGLNAGPFSFPSQLLGSSYSKKFAYCLPDRVTNLNSSGVIQFGDYELPTKLAYTPLVPPFSPLGGLYYYLDLQGISLGKELLKIPPSSFRSNASAIGGTVLDSGTAITHLVETAYRSLVQAMLKATARLHPFSSKEAGGDVCYKIPVTARLLPNVPSITFHFVGGVDLELGAASILYPALVQGNNIVLCAAFASSGSSPLNIIGNYQQQNYWIEYDLLSSRVGFAKANCAMN